MDTKRELRELAAEDVIEMDHVDTGGSSYVILYNDDWHDFIEVVSQVVLATRYSVREAERSVHKVHVEGKANVFNGSLEDCLAVSAVLEEIELKTEIVH